MAEDTLCKNLLIGISGSIHALQIYNYLLLFRQSFAESIKVIMTENATHMIDQKVVELYINDRVFVDLWDRSPSVAKAAHIQLSQWADLFVVIPASADILGKAACGIADDLLSTAILSYSKPIVFVPAMNKIMWQSRALQRNIKLLEGDGHYIVPPDSHSFAAGTGEHDQAVSSTPDTVLLHLKHVRMKQLRNEYWEEATREKPLTPSERRKQELERLKGETNETTTQ